MHAAPIMGKPLDTITRADVLDIVQPLLTSKTRTGRIVRQRIRKTFAHAIARDERLRENPAGEAIEAALTGRKCAEPNRRRSIPFEEVSEALTIIERSGAAEATRLVP